MKRKIFYQFIAPSNALMFLLMIIPLAYAAYLSFHFVTFMNINTPDPVGFQNYLSIFSDPKFWEAFRFSLLIIVITVPTQIFIGFLMALFLDQVNPIFRGLFLACFLLPFIVVPVVGTLMFKQLFETGGLIEWLYGVVFNQPFQFNPTSVKSLIILHLIWHATPYPLVVFFAGLQTLPQDHLEAAAVDGATRLQQLKYIVIPHLRPLLLMATMILIMDMYRMFDSILVISEQNPIYHAENLMMYNFRIGIKVQRLGRANATAVLTVLGVLVVLIPWLRKTYQSVMGKD
ncbi:MAG: carbohydrate ABC transporter permease [Spirochaetota bacterium]